MNDFGRLMIRWVNFRLSFPLCHRGIEIDPVNRATSFGCRRRPWTEDETTQVGCLDTRHKNNGWTFR